MEIVLLFLCLNLICSVRTYENKALSSLYTDIEQVNYDHLTDIKALMKYYLYGFTSHVFLSGRSSKFIDGIIHGIHGDRLIFRIKTTGTHSLSEQQNREEMAFTFKTQKVKVYPYLDKADNIVFLFGDGTLPELGNILQYVERFPFWIPTARFLIILPQCIANTQRYNLASVFRDLRSKNIFKSIVTCWKTRRGRFGNFVFTFDAFKDTVSDITSRSKNESELNAIVDEALKDLRGYRMRVSLFPNSGRAYVSKYSDGSSSYHGSDGEMLNALAKHMNFLPVVSSPADNDTYGYIMDNGTATGAVGDILYGRVDFAINSKYVLHTKGVLAYTYPHDKDDLCVLVPKAKRVPRYRSLFAPFSGVVWLALLLSLLGSTVFVYGSRNCRRRDCVSTIALETYRTFISGGFRMEPITIGERQFLSIILFFSVVMTNAFQGCLTSHLVTPRYLPDINTLKGLDDSGLHILVYPGLGRFLKTNARDPVLSGLLDKFVAVPYIEDASRIVVDTGAYALLYNRFFAHYNWRRSELMDDGFPQLHIMEEIFLPAFVSYAFPPRSPFLPRIDILIRRVIEGGLLGYWEGRTFHELTLKKVLSLPTRRVQPPTVISLSHLQTAFYILGLGISGSLFVFVSELYCVNIHGRQTP